MTHDQARDRAYAILLGAARALHDRERAAPSSMRPIVRTTVLLAGPGDRVVLASLDRRSVPRLLRGEWAVTGAEDERDPVLALAAMGRVLFALEFSEPDRESYAAWPIRRVTVDTTESGMTVDLEVLKAAAVGADGAILRRTSFEREPSVA